MDASPDLIPALCAATSIHVFGAGLNAERTSHTAVPELRKRGWRVVPVHPRDAGACIEGVPIRGSVEAGTPLEVAVLFLAPERARAQVRRLLMTNVAMPPLVWFQPGAEDDMALEWLMDAGWGYVHADCIGSRARPNRTRIAHQKRHTGGLFIEKPLVVQTMLAKKKTLV